MKDLKQVAHHPAVSTEGFASTIVFPGARRIEMIRRAGRVAMTCGLVLAHPAIAEESKQQEQPAAYAVSGPLLSFHNTPNRKHTIINSGDATALSQVAITLSVASDVLVQFTSGVTTVTPEGCPCSVRASLQVDGQEPIVIKRINLSGANTRVGATYQPDRQSLDGSFVFSLPAGRHEIALIAQRIEGDSKLLYAFYQNIQAIAFARAGATP